MTAQSSTVEVFKTAFEIWNSHYSMTVLSALREACDYNIDLYKSCIVQLAQRLGLVDPDKIEPWPVYALSLSEWETASTTTHQCIKHLLCAGTTSDSIISHKVVHK